MLTLQTPTISAARRIADCTLISHAVVKATTEQIKGLRLRPDPAAADPLPAAALRHSAEQTVVALAAVYRALHLQQWTPERCREWGVIVASRFLGRSAVAKATRAFAEEGAYGVSPQLIPHESLHSPSGTISQLLKIHGPNFGAGGGPDGAGDPFLAGFALLASECVPAVWIVCTGYIQSSIAKPAGPSHCVAVALALTRSSESINSRANQERRGPHLRMPFSSAGTRQARLCLTRESSADVEPISLESLLDAFSDSQGMQAHQWNLPSGGLVLSYYKEGQP